MKIAIGAGHGPNTAGKRSVDGKLKEFQFNSRVVDLIVNLLSEYEDVETLITSDKAKDVPLTERINKANEWGANLYLSIHANAHGDGKTWTNAKGIECFIDDSKPKESLVIATAIQTELIRETGKINRGVKFKNFYVLDKSKMSAVLCELGFMTHIDEVEDLKNESYRLKVARAIVRALAMHYKLKIRPKKALKSPKGYIVQAGYFKSRIEADRHITALKEKGVEAFIKEVDY